MSFAAVVVLGYLLGSCPWGHWLVHLIKHEDIREVGSGNIGATNVWRTYGRWLGAPVVLLDVLKGFVPAMLGVLFVSLRYASVASIVAGIALPVFAVLYGYPTSVVLFGTAAAVAILFLHRANLGRLRAGTESRFHFRRP